MPVLAFKSKRSLSCTLNPLKWSFVFLKEVGREEDSSDDDLESSLLEDPETCLQMNYVYQEVIQEKIEEVELLIAQNKEQQVSKTDVEQSCAFQSYLLLSSFVNHSETFLMYEVQGSAAAVMALSCVLV